MLQETLLLTTFFTIITHPDSDCKQFSLPFRQHSGAQKTGRSPTGYGGDEAVRAVQQGHIGVAQDADERPGQVVQHAGGQTQGQDALAVAERQVAAAAEATQAGGHHLRIVHRPRAELPAGGQVGGDEQDHHADSKGQQDSGDEGTDQLHHLQL